MYRDGACEGVRVFVVDDERIICSTIAKYLNKIGCNAKAFTRGLDALREIDEFRPDVIIIDYKMPGLNGLDTIRKIRETQFDGYIAIATASELDIIRGEATALGVAGFITKPISLDALREIVERAGKSGGSPQA